MSRNSLTFAVVLIVLGLLTDIGVIAAPPQAAPPRHPTEQPPTDPPAWLAPFRLRYTLHIPGNRAKSSATSIIAELPTGGRLRPDAADVAVQTAEGERLSVSVLSHDPRGNTVIQFPRRGDSPWYWVYAVAGAAQVPAAPRAANTGPLPEGVTVEVRRWAGDDLADWGAVREGLSRSDNVMGNAVVADVVQNCNPARPNDPRQFAASYRGFLQIPADGVYRFFLNAEDAAFLFIDGFKVTERVGNNTRVTGAIAVRSIGDDVELKAGVHPFEVHHVMGNNPTAIGYCALMWVPPAAKNWAFVPHTAFARADYARVAAIDEVQNRPAAQFMYGIDDTLRSGDGGLVYLVQFAASGPGSDDAALSWNFGDGTTGQGSRPRHVYFNSGDYEVTLQSGDLPPYRMNVHVWPAPLNTSPLSLSAALESLSASDWQTFDVERLQRMFEFLRVCEQPRRWPLLSAVAERLLSQPSLDLKQKLVIYTTRMEALAHEGRADEAIALGDKVLGEFGRVPSLLLGVKLAIAHVYHRHLKQLDRAAAQYEAIVNEHRRVEHPDVRMAAIRWGDLHAEAGNLSRAGECYRLAKALGGQAFEGSSLTAAVTRGGLLRTAEQKLRADDIQQTRQLLERIELNYPEEKLEGMYRVLRADADRRTGHYEEALRNYEILLKLTQWSGFHDRALHGLADTYFRLGDLPRAVQWLDSLEKTYPRYYAKQTLGEFRKLLADRQARLAAAADGGTTAANFTDIAMHFEPDETTPWGELLNIKVTPGLGIVGQHVGVSTSMPLYLAGFDFKRPIPTLHGGDYWVELWYRDAMSSITPASPHIHLWLYDDTFSKQGPYTGRATYERTFGVWRKIGFLLSAPLSTTKGSIAFSARLITGTAEFDGLRVQAVTDRQVDALNNFLKGSDVE